MKVILLDTVPHVGKRFEVKEVKPGLARNFLIPQKKAIPATEESIRHIEKLKQASKEKEKLDQDLLEKNISALSGKKIIIRARANETGHLYAQIGKEEIVRALSEEHLVFQESHIALVKPIKEIGTHMVPIRVGHKEGSAEIVVERGD